MLATLVFAVMLVLMLVVANATYERGRARGAVEENERAVKILRMSIAVKNSPTARLAMMRIAGDIDDEQLGEALDSETPYIHIQKFREKKEK